jgi:uridylate kinase
MDNPKIVSVGGSLVAPEGGFDINFLQEFRELVIKQVEQEDQEFIFIIGGGAPARKYQNGLDQVVDCSDEDLDWIGIEATVLNAQFVRRIFKTYAYGEVVKNPTNQVETSKPILIASGWKPGCSTDHDSVLMAETYGAEEVINLSNIEHVYDKDPAKYDDAEPIDQISWQEFQDLVGDKWEPGANLPFDPVATEKARELGLKVSILKGNNLQEVEKVFNSKEFAGTVIH